MADFSQFNLHPKLSESVEKLGFSIPTQIQQKAIPLIQSGQDVAGLAQTGTGKTAAFLMPVLQRLYLTRETDESVKLEGVKPYEDWGPRSMVLVLVPTRELAEQVAGNLKELSVNNDISYTTIYGGVPYEKQKAALKAGVDFIIATPGRLIDLYKDKTFDPSQIKCVIFDEADRMFDMGFKEDMCYLLDRIPRDRQFLVFSATLNFDVLTVAYEFGSDPVEIEIDRDVPKTDQVKDEIFHVGSDEKPQFLLSLLKLQKYEQAVVFSNFVRNVPRIEKFLKSNGLKAVGISSALSQGQRTRVMEEFRAGKINVLVATDVAARGLDIDNIDLVINYELPDDSENYVHRIGRTGRAGREGLAFSVVSEKDVPALKRLETFLGSKLSIGWMEDENLVSDFSPFPYTYDPKAQLRNLNFKESRSPYDKKPKGKKPYDKKSHEKKPYKKDKKFSSEEGKNSLKSKTFEKKKSGNPKVKKAVVRKNKSTSSSRYENYKTKPRSSKGKGFWGKVISFFSN